MEPAMTNFEPGDQVIHTARAGEGGVIIRFVHRYGDQDWYKVRFGSIDRTVSARSLTPANSVQTLLDHLLRARSHPSGLRRIITARKIAFGMRDLVYSLGATKTKLFPYQYKPLLKLIQSSARRILVADEVGLGKTIEAGFVIMETVARNPRARVVVVCPAGLRSKWREEMASRFGLTFEVLDRSTARRRVAEGIDRQDDSTLRAIVSYETIRGDEFLNAIKEEDGPDLLVVDEAHRTRHAQTSTALSVHRLTSVSNWAVYLTATPIQTSDEDLYTLLHALNPSEFISVPIFRARAELNRFVVTAESAIQTKGVEGLVKARKSLGDAAVAPNAAILTTNTYYPVTMAALQTAIDDFETTDPETHIRTRVELQAKLFELNLLSPYYTRTRRRHVHTEFAIRQVQTVRRAMTDYEREVYNNLQQAIFAEYRANHGSAIARLVLVSYQMQLASSLNGAIRRLKSKIGTVFEIEDDEADTLEELTGVSTDEIGHVPPRFARVSAVLRDVDLDRLEKDDSKWSALKQILQDSDKQAGLEGNPPPKVLVFSFYRASLDVIEKRLTECGIQYRRIDGSVPHHPDNEERDEKGRRIRQFRDDPSVRVLIASQVGSEGLDLQFANTVVNWDLPWNPMVIEQRIGRVDRIGQQSKFVYAFNIVLQDTVEDRIVARLYERLKIFEEHIGECESVMGETLETIHREIFQGTLRPEQEAARIEIAELAIQTNRLQNEQLQDHIDSLVGQEQFLIDRIEHLKRTGRYIAPEELLNFVQERLLSIDPDSSLVCRDDGSTYDFRAGALFRQTAERARQRHDRPWQQFVSHIATKPLALTFVAEDRQRSNGTTLVHAMHPLVRTLVLDQKEVVDGQLLAFEGSIQSDRIPPGTYVAVVMTATDASQVVGASILTAACRVNDQQLLGQDAADELINAMVVRGTAVVAKMTIDDDSIVAAYESAEIAVALRLAHYRDSVTNDESNRRNRRREQLNRDAEIQIATVRQMIDGVVGDGNSNDSGKKMQILPIYTKRIEKIETTRDERLKDLINVKEACIEGTTFAAGLVTVTATNPEDICQEQHT